MFNLINKIRIKLWIQRYCWNMLMMKKVEQSLEHKFIDKANEQKNKMISAIETEETWLAEQPESHKYEDRQAKLRAEKKLRMLKESLKGQEKQIEDGKKATRVVADNIAIIEENSNYLKGRF